MPGVPGRAKDPDILVVDEAALMRAWHAAGSPSLNEMVLASRAIGVPLARSTLHAVRARAQGNPNPAYTGRLGLRKADALARILGVEVGDLFIHGTGVPVPHELSHV